MAAGNQKCPAISLCFLRKKIQTLCTFSCTPAAFPDYVSLCLLDRKEKLQNSTWVTERLRESQREFKSSWASKITICQICLLPSPGALVNQAHSRATSAQLGQNIPEGPWVSVCLTRPSIRQA